MISGFKKSNKKKGKLVLAKDKKQAVLALVVLCLFVINSIYTAIKIYRENNPAPVASVNTEGQQDMASQDGTTTSPQDTAIPPEGTADTSANAPSDAPGDVSNDANDIYFQTIGMKEKANNGPDTQLTPDENIDILTSKNGGKRFGKTVLISVDNSQTSNPFLPNDGVVKFTGSRKKAVSLPFLTLPPETVSPSSSDAGRVMTTTISGILYDKYSPSAIINIEGSDYLVKRGDIINHYKILFIGKKEVIVQLGRNIYKAGVGELLSPTDLNYNTIANLNKKFGGNKVQIKVKKKS